MGDSIGMFFCPSSARISAESSFIALVVLRPSVSQPASATTAASAAEVSKPRTYPENFNPMLPDPWSRTGPDRPVLRYPLSLKMRQSQGSPNPYRRSSMDMVNERLMPVKGGSQAPANIEEFLTAVAADGLPVHDRKGGQ